jgi:bifunctional enzyme CysN/CysC
MTENTKDNYLDMELLRFTTCGSVDDGKSTLIGRLLYDCKSIFEDQLEALERSNKLKGDVGIDLAHLTDGLRAEREQGITIDVAYRYFATPKRKFIIADTPGHVQYTRNMVTGASTADLAIILIDARLGVQEQSKRHAFIASLLGIPHLLVAVNKMDLKEYSEDVFNDIVNTFKSFAQKLDIQDISFIPISALNGDNVVDESKNMPWYKGTTVLQHLESVYIASDQNLVDFRFPVQYVIRPDLNFRGFAGRVESGTIKSGEEITVLPSRRKSIVKSIETYEGQLDEAFASQAVTLTLNDEIDISRGDMIVRSNNMPSVNTNFDAMVCWMVEDEMKVGKHYILKHNTREVRAFIEEAPYKVDMDTLHRQKTESFQLNDIGRIRIRSAAPIFFDPYKNNRRNGNFILIDPDTKITVAAGMIRSEVKKDKHKDHIERNQSDNVKWEEGRVAKTDRESRNGHRAKVIWFTGLSAAGKSTLASGLEKKLFDHGLRTVMLDGDNIRHGLSGDLGFSEDDRRENIRRVGEVAKLFYEVGAIVLCPFISPYDKDRKFVRDLFPNEDFVQVYVDCDIETCKKRDPKGLYAKVEKGDIQDFTGITSPYEAPSDSEFVFKTAEKSEEECIGELFEVIKNTIKL